MMEKKVLLSKRGAKLAAKIWAANTLRNCASENLDSYFEYEEVQMIIAELQTIADKLSNVNVHSVKDLFDIFFEYEEPINPKTVV